MQGSEFSHKKGGVDKIMAAVLKGGTIMRTRITYKKIHCHKRYLACRWFIVKKAKIF